jgi:hypothetical protein
MTKTLITTAATALLLLAGVGCLPTAEPTHPHHPALGANDLGEYFPTPTPSTLPAVVVWPNDGQSHGDVTPPQRLDIDGVELAECNDMGGRFVGPAEAGSLGRCEGVDY